MAGDVVLFTGSSALFHASRLAVSVFAAAALAPAAFALWGVFLIVLSYSNYANLGILNGANRELPLALGRGDVALSERIEQGAYAGALATGLLLAGATLGLFAANPALAAAAAAALALQQLYLFEQVSLRSRLEFRRASVLQIVLAVTFPSVAVLLLPALGIIGLVAAQAAAFGLGSALALVAWRFDLRPSFDTDVLKRLIRVGLPIMTGGLVFAVVVTADRWLVATALGQTALGQYTLAGLLPSAGVLASMVMAQQFYPRMAMRFGETGAIEAIYPLAVRQSLLSIITVGPPALLASLAVPMIIDRWLPEYAPASQAAQLLLIGVVPLAAAGGFGNLLITVGRAGWYVILLLAALSAELILGAATLHLGWGMAGVAGAAACAYAVLALGALVAARRLMRDGHR